MKRKLRPITQLVVNRQSCLRVRHPSHYLCGDWVMARFWRKYPLPTSKEDNSQFQHQNVCAVIVMVKSVLPPSPENEKCVWPS